MQQVYGEITDRVYFKVRLPLLMTGDFVNEFGPYQWLGIQSEKMLRLGKKRHNKDIISHILNVREFRGYNTVHFWQLMFPVAMSTNMTPGDEVMIWRGNYTKRQYSCKGDTIFIQFKRDLFWD